MLTVETSRREEVGRLLSRSKRDILAEWQRSRALSVPASRRIPAEELRREDSELFDHVVDAVRTGDVRDLARLATSLIERRFLHQYIAEDVIAETVILRDLCLERAAACSPDGSGWRAVSLVFDRHVQELFRVATELLLLKLEQRTSDLERFFSFSEIILNTMKDAVLVTDLHGRIVKANRATLSLLKYTEEEILGLAPPYPFWDQSQEALARTLVEDCLRSGSAVDDLECFLTTRSGERLSFHVHAVPVRTNLGEPTGVLMVFRDLREIQGLVGELRRANTSLEDRIAERTQEIETQRARLEWILASLHDLVIITDMRGRITRVNEACARGLGRPREDLTSLTFGDLECPGSPHPLECGRKASLARMESIADVEGRFAGEKGQPIAVAATFAPLRDADGKVQGVVCVARDMRERYALFTQREVANNINRILASGLDVRSSFDAIADELRRLFPFDRMSVAVRVPGRVGYQVYAASAENPEMRSSPPGPLPALDGLVARIVSENRIHRVADLRELGDPSLEFLVAAGIRSSLGIPLNYRGAVIGTLNFGSRETGAFGDIPESLLCEIGAQIAVAVENSRICGDTAYAASLHAAVIAAITDPVLFTDPDGRVLQANKAMVDLSGFSVEEAAGRSWASMAQPTDMDGARRMHEEIMSKGSVVRWPMTARRRDGSPVDVEISSGLVRDPEGRPIQIISIVREVHPAAGATTAGTGTDGAV